MKKLLLVGLLAATLIGCGKQIKINQVGTGEFLQSKGYELTEPNNVVKTYTGGNLFTSGIGVINVLNVPKDKINVAYSKMQDIHARYKTTISSTNTISEYNYQESYVTIIKDDDCVIEIYGTGAEYLNLRTLFLREYPELI